MSSPVDEALADLARAFDALAVRWYLFGAQAAILYGSTRVTESRSPSPNRDPDRG